MEDGWDFKGVHITEWIKIGLAFLAIIIAINEFVIKNDEIEAVKINNGRVFLMKGVDENVLNSLMKVIKYSENDGLDSSKKWQVLLDATPMHEYLVAWSSCVANDMCARSTSEKFLCQRLIGYEKLAEKVLPKIDMEYDSNMRDQIYSGMLTYCNNR